MDTQLFIVCVGTIKASRWWTTGRCSFPYQRYIDATTTNKEGINALHLVCAFNETDRLVDGIRLLIDEGGL